MALTTAEIAVALRITADPNVAPAEPLLSILHRQLQTAVSLIDLYAPAAPEHVRDEAAIRLTGYLYELPPTSGGSPGGGISQSPIRHSGALPLLSPYHVPTPLNTGSPLTPIAIPETPINPYIPPHVGTHYRYIGWSDDQTVSQVELDGAVQFDSDILTSPVLAVSGYLFIGVPEDIGYPDSILLDGNNTNIVGSFARQTGFLVRDMENVVLLITNQEQGPLSGNRTWTLGYN